jgi:ABC-2 type transport system ATP-binding protein
MAAQYGWKRALLELDGLSKGYGEVHALVGVDLRVERGEAVCLIGPNGAGKTTLVSMIVGLRRPDTGTVRVDGVDPVVRPEMRERIGFAPQDTGVYPSLTVAENLRFFGRLGGLRGRLLAARVEETAVALGVADLLGRRTEHLSGGERRRVHVASAVLTRPPLVVLDEATAGIDVDARHHLIEFVRSRAAGGSAVLYSTHYMQEVEDLGAEVVILDHGRVIARGEVRDLLRRHGSVAVELAFDGPPPALDLPWPTAQLGHVLRITTEDAAAAVVAVFAALRPETFRLRTIEILRPNLEAVFVTLTGRRFDTEPTRASDASTPDATPVEVVANVPA